MSAITVFDTNQQLQYLYLYDKQKEPYAVYNSGNLASIRLKFKDCLFYNHVVQKDYWSPENATAFRKAIFVQLPNHPPDVTTDTR